MTDPPNGLQSHTDASLSDFNGRITFTLNPLPKPAFLAFRSHPLAAQRIKGVRLMPIKKSNPLKYSTLPMLTRFLYSPGNAIQRGDSCCRAPAGLYGLRRAVLDRSKQSARRAGVHE